MKNTKLILMTLVICLMAGSLASAQSFPDNWKKFDLSQYHMPFSIMAPASATFDYDGDSEELYINAEDDRYRLMISVYEDKVEDLVAEYKGDIEENEDAPLVGFIHDEANGFVAEEDFDGTSDYEVIYVFAVKGKTYLVQTNPLIEGGVYTEEEATNMFKACQGAAGM